MKDIRLVDTSSVQWKRIASWLFVLVLREYGVNIYNENSTAYELLDMSEEEIDLFFQRLITQDKIKHQTISRGLDKARLIESVRGR